MMPKMGLMKLENDKQCPKHPRASKTNPFDSDSESETTPRPTRASVDCAAIKSSVDRSSCKNDENRRPSTPPHLYIKQRCNDRAIGVSESCNEHEQEKYDVCKAEETTTVLRNCLKIVEDIQEDAANSLVKLHHQGEQIRSAHLSAVNIEHDLSRGEKLLGSLGGIFSKAWKPKITQEIKGPALISDESFEPKRRPVEKTEWFNLSFIASKRKPNTQERPLEATSAQGNVKMEMAKQDDMLTDLSNSLNLLKDMASDMKIEISRQNTALDALHNDVDLLSNRINGANQRSRRLLGK